MDYLCGMNLKQKLQLRTLELNRDTAEILLSSKNKKNTQHKTGSDSYIPMCGDTDIYANYTGRGMLQQNMTADENQKIWNYLSNFSGTMQNGEFVIDNKVYKSSEVSKIPSGMLQDLKAEENTLVLKSGVFYGVETNDGGTETKWGMKVSNRGGVGIALSETIYAVEHGITLEELGEWSSFFRFVTDSGDSAGAGIYLGLSHEKVRSMLDTLGFEPGMCTINVGGKENTFYYSHNGNIYPKYHYDGIYQGMTVADNSDNYEVGDEFNYNGHIYTMDEKGHINVPYGEDVFNCLSRPKGKRYLGI